MPTVDGLGPVGGDDHTEREWIELASVGPRVDAIVALCGERYANVMTPRPGAPERRSS